MVENKTSINKIEFMAIIDVKPKNDIPAQTAVRIANIIGVRVTYISSPGVLLNWYQSVQNKVGVEKLLLTPKDVNCLDFLPSLYDKLHAAGLFATAPESCLVYSTEPFIVYCLKGKGISRLVFKVYSLEDLSEHSPILLSAGIWYFSTQLQLDLLA